MIQTVCHIGLCMLCALLICPTFALSDPGVELKHRWVYIQTNLLVDKNVERTLEIIEQSARFGYNGIVIADSKFMRWDNLPERYAKNARKVRELCRSLGIDFIPCVFSIGYSNDLLSRDVNLAAGLPVVDAPFVVRDGNLMPADDLIKIANASFEEYENNMPNGWGFVDQPGEISFIDTYVKYEGNASLRIQDIGTHDPQHGHGRAHQKLSVRPFTYYHISVAVRTQDFEAVHQIRIAVLAGGASLNYFEPRMEKTQDWKRVDITFNSLEFSEVNFYLWVWGGKGGKLWWDDVQIEPAGFVNVLRRDGAPLQITSEDGQTVYTEGSDFHRIEDPKLGNDPWPGAFNVWHEPPVVSIPAGGRLKDGQTVLVSYYHPALIYDGAVMCCMSEPKLYEILEWQAEQIRENLDPDGYFMSHDEMRTQGWDPSCTKRNMTPGQILADNVKRCTEILRKSDPGKPIYVWSDMFDPHHNAGKTGKYYIVKGDGPWYGSWEGLPEDVVVVNWNGREGIRSNSMKHFSERGHKQILAGYYDAAPEKISDWMRDAEAVEGVIGVMYTTWRSNYTDLEEFAEHY